MVSSFKESRFTYLVEQSMSSTAGRSRCDVSLALRLKTDLCVGQLVATVVRRYRQLVWPGVHSAVNNKK